MKRGQIGELRLKIAILCLSALSVSVCVDFLLFRFAFQSFFDNVLLPQICPPAPEIYIVTESKYFYLVHDAVCSI